MRKIRKDEIKKTAWTMAENFYNYPLYKVFFPNDEKRLKQTFYFFWMRMYTRRNFSYVTDDMSLVISFQKPEDKQTSSLGLYLNPVFLFGGLATVPLSALKIANNYVAFAETFEEKYYNPHTDCCIQAVCVMEKSRGDGQFFNVLKELDDGRPIFFETHTEENVKLYKYMGAEICDEGQWQGVTHYVMKKRGKYLTYVK